MFQAGAYLRLSKEDGDKEVSDSIENQKTCIYNFVKDHTDIHIIDFFIDDGYSGLNFQRPAFITMLSEIYKGNLNTVITKDMSRLGREHIETSNYIEKIFPSHSIRYIAVLDNYDSFTGSNVELAPFKSLFNDMYAKDISKKVRSAFLSKMTRGEFIGAFAPYGYTKHPENNDLLIIDNYAAAIVKRIFYLYQKGLPKLQIAKILNEESILCPSAYKKQTGLQYKNTNKLKSTCYWTYSTIHKILQNEVYIGNMVQHKSETISYKVDKKRTIKKENCIIVKNTHEPIVDTDTFESVQKLLCTKKRLTKQTGTVALYAGILKCGDCGRAMSKSSSFIGKGEKAYYYKCGTYKAYGKTQCSAHTIREDILSFIVLKAIQEEVKKLWQSKNNTELIHFIKKLQNKANDTDNSILLENKLEKINYYLKKTYEDYADKLLSKKEYLFLNQQYTKEKTALQTQLEKWNTVKAEQTTLFLNHTQWIEKWIDSKNFTHITRELIVELIDSIKVYEGKKLEIQFKFEHHFAE